MEKSTLKTMKFGREKLKNIWFFYKKQIIAGVLILAVLIFLLVQCIASKKDDMKIYVAGDVYLTSDAQKEVCKAFAAVIPDEYADSIGVISATVGESIVVKGTEDEKRQTYMDYTGQQQTMEQFKQQLRLPDSAICLLSPDCFATAAEDEGTLQMLDTVFDTLPEGTLENKLGIPLGSLPFGKSNAVLKDFDGWILCIKSPSILRDDDEYARQIEAFKAVVEYAPVH